MKKLLTILLLLSTFGLAEAQIMDGKVIVEQDGSILLPLQKLDIKSLQTPRINKEFKAIGTDNPQLKGWTVMRDRVTGNMHRAFGKSVQIDGYTNITRNNVEEAAMAFIRANKAALHLNPDNLQLVRANLVNNKWYVTYKQIYNGYEVMFSEVELRIHKNGKVMAMGSDFYNNLSVDTKADISSSEATSKASYGLKYDEKSCKAQANNQMYILPVKTANSIIFRPVYRVNIDIDNSPDSYDTYVDAKTGDVLWRRNRTLQATGTSTGTIKMVTPEEDPVKVNFNNMKVKIGMVTRTLSEDGTLDYDPEYNQVVTASLTGPWGNVEMDGTASAAFEGVWSPGEDMEVVWDDDNSTIYERIMFYHVNYVHSYIKGIDPNFKGMDHTCNITLDYDGYQGTNSPNATSDGNGDVNFYGIGQESFNVAESPGVLYHEYGHSINTTLYYQLGVDQGMTSLTAHEAFADLNACLIHDIPEVGKQAFGKWGAPWLRNIKNEIIYPDSVKGESHHDGQILAGAYWDIRELTDDLDYARNLVHYVKYSLVDDEDLSVLFSEWFIETLIYDDDDDDITNGTPHLAAIVEGFNNHGIGTNLLATKSFSHTPVENVEEASSAINTEFLLQDLGGFALTINNAKLVYSTDGFVTEHETDATSQDGSTYVASFPAMEGAHIVQYYFKATEELSGDEINFYANSSNEPFIFLIAYKDAWTQNFENKPNWTIGSYDDDAETGIWECDSPEETYLSTYDGAQYLLQIGEDHTTEGSDCYVTGNINDPYNPYESLPDGKTTLVSPVYDISQLEKPVIEYYYFLTLITMMQMNAGGFQVYLSSNSGNSWKLVSSQEMSTSEVWKQRLLLIEDYVELSESFRVKFEAEGMFLMGYPIVMVEAMIDDFSIKTANDNQIHSIGVNDNRDKHTTQCWPNPFTTSVNISTASASGQVTANIYDIYGNLTATVSSNNGQMTWNGLDAQGNPAATGVYYCRIQNGSANEVVIINKK